MKTINVNLVQNRVENTFGNAQTEFAIIKAYDGEAFVVAGDEAANWLHCDCGYSQAAKVIVTHPAIMWGDTDEVKSDMIREVRKAAIKSGVCVENIAGYLFVK